MSKKVCLISLSVMGMILLNFSLTATSLKCYTCSGARKEPDQDASCSNTTKPCSGAENRCMIRLNRDKSSQPRTYELACIAKDDCKHLNDGCIKHDDQTLCSKCCSTDLCNTPTTFRSNQSFFTATTFTTATSFTTVTSATSAPSTTSTSARTQILPIIFFLATLTVFWFCD